LSGEGRKDRTQWSDYTKKMGGKASSEVRVTKRRRSKGGRPPSKTRFFYKVQMLLGGQTKIQGGSNEGVGGGWKGET